MNTHFDQLIVSRTNHEGGWYPTGKISIQQEHTLNASINWFLQNSVIHLVLRLRGGGGAEHEQDSDDESRPQDLYSGSRKRKFIFRRNNTVEEIKPNSPKRPRLTLASQIRLLLFNSWLHLLFFFVPAGFAVNYCHANSIVVFCINFIAIVPSAMELSLAVDEISLRTGELLEGIISMTFR